MTIDSVKETRASPAPNAEFDNRPKIPEDIKVLAAATVEAIERKCRDENIFLGTVNARAVIREFIAGVIMTERDRRKS